MDFQLWSLFSGKSSLALLCVLLLYGILPSTQAEKHSLYYIYTGLSKPVDLPGIYEFSAMGLLDDIQIDYYNSKEKRKIPKQPWMKEKMPEDYWEKGTQSRKSKEQWFRLSLKNLMDRMKHNESESQWVAPVDAALPTKRKWDSIHILNQYTKGYLEKECVDWLNKFREYGDKELRNGSPPDVHIFAKRSIRDKTKLKLTCMATGFYHKDVMLIIRKYRISPPEDEIEYTGIRPNHDESFQMSKSVEIKEEERAEYDCFVAHRSLKEPIIVKWDGKCRDCPSVSVPDIIEAVFGAMIGAAIVVVLLLVVVAALVLVKKKMNALKRRNVQEPDDNKPHFPLKEGQDTSSGDDKNWCEVKELNHNSGQDTSSGDDTNCWELKELNHDSGQDTSSGDDTNCWELKELNHDSGQDTDDEGEDVNQL